MDLLGTIYLIICTRLLVLIYLYICIPALVLFVVNVLEHPSTCRAIAPGVLNNGFQTMQHIMRMSRTWDSTMSMIPKGGDTIWGDLDWSPEEGYTPTKSKQRNTDTQKASQDGPESEISQTKRANYGRIISFGKDVAEALSSDIERIDFRVSLFVFLNLLKRQLYL